MHNEVIEEIDLFKSKEFEDGEVGITRCGIVLNKLY